LFHIVLIQALPPSTDYLGIVSDRRLLSWFFSFAEQTPSFLQLLSNSLYSLALPSLNIDSAVVASTSSRSVLDAMKLMSEEGVSSVAVVEEETGNLLSAVSVTDIGKVSVATSEGYRLLT
jgi:CBS domain-containing protein